MPDDAPELGLVPAQIDGRSRSRSRSRSRIRETGGIACVQEAQYVEIEETIKWKKEEEEEEKEEKEEKKKKKKKENNDEEQSNSLVCVYFVRP
jgi:hypothetical protein